MIANITKLSIAGLIAGGIGLATASAWADEGRSQEEQGLGFSVGVGVWGVRNPMEGAKKEPESGFFPYISYENDWLSIDPSGAAVKVFGAEHFMVQGLVAPRWLLVDPKDSTIHNDLKRKSGVDLGARASVMAGPVMGSIEYRGDVSDRSNGHEVTGELGVEVDLPGNGSLGVKGGAYWRDSNLNTYLYGVYVDEARPDRPAYRIEEGFSPFAGLMLRYPVIDKVEVVMASEVEFLPDRITDSPIIARQIVPSAFIGMFYSF